jgi:hypothetical protein
MQPSLAHYRLSLNIPLSTLFSYTLLEYDKTKFHDHTKQRVELKFVHVFRRENCVLLNGSMNFRK